MSHLNAVILNVRSNAIFVIAFVSWSISDEWTDFALLEGQICVFIVLCCLSVKNSVGFFVMQSYWYMLITREAMSTMPSA